VASNGTQSRGAVVCETSARELMVANASQQAQPAAQQSKTPALDEFGRDLTADAAAGRIDPLIGRTDEIDQPVEILARRPRPGRRSRARAARAGARSGLTGQCGCSPPVAAGGRDSSASDVIVSDPRAASSSTIVASSSERAYSSTSRCTTIWSSSCLW
jgi:hypothetical protein